MASAKTSEVMEQFKRAVIPNYPRYDIVFEVDFEFTMSGYWEITIDIDGVEGSDQLVAAYEVQ